MYERKIKNNVNYNQLPYFNSRMRMMLKKVFVLFQGVYKITQGCSRIHLFIAYEFYKHMVLHRPTPPGQTSRAVSLLLAIHSLVNMLTWIPQYLEGPPLCSVLYSHRVPENFRPFTQVQAATCNSGLCQGKTFENSVST